ncbi:MAG: hypothetical protein J7M09_02020, partial [Deltaproteobacteria bacterium]|nr:hypothetical protein [Candidatus Tharpella sp.]
PVLSADSEESLAARILRCEHKIFPRALALFCAGKLQIKDRKVKVLGLDEVLLAEQFLISCPVE